MNSKKGPARKVILFLVDGMRPDGMRLADAPFLAEVPTRGVFTHRAASVMPTTTLPCITSLFLSCPPDVHGINGNDWVQIPSSLTSLFDFIRRQDLAAASFYNWEPLRDLSRPGSLSASCFLEDVRDDGGKIDRELSAMAVSWLTSHDWDFAFVYFQNTDKVGHLHGWMSDPYLAAIGNADHCIQQICRALPEETVVIITSDHGGHEKTHHTDLPEDMTIPIMMYGPGIPAQRELTGPVNIIDIAPTVAGILGLEPPPAWMGRRMSF